MNTTPARNLPASWLAALTFFTCLAGTTWAQKAEKLTKGDREYYGWQTSPTEFKTCSGTTIPVENGQIVRTARDCPGRPPINAVEFRGKVIEVAGAAAPNGGANLTVKKEDGSTANLFIPAVLLSGKGPLTSLVRPGDNVKVEATSEGRVEAIARQQ